MPRPSGDGDLNGRNIYYDEQKKTSCDDTPAETKEFGKKI
jgi:hypothetical protein